MSTLYKERGLEADIKDIINILNKNLYLLYTRMIDESYIINYYYQDGHANAAILVNLEFFIPSSNVLLNQLVVFPYVLHVFQILFDYWKPGIYKKKKDITYDNFILESNKIKTNFKSKINAKISEIKSSKSFSNFEEYLKQLNLEQQKEFLYSLNKDILYLFLDKSIVDTKFDETIKDYFRSEKIIQIRINNFISLLELFST